MKNFLKLFKTKDKKAKILIITGLVGMALIFLSQFSSQEPTKEMVRENEVTASEYKSSLEKSLETFIGSIEGVGKTKVLITLKGSGETEFLKETKTDFSDAQKSVSESYVMTDSKDGRNTVVKSRADPEIKGVLVICDGADNIRIKGEVLSAVTTALDLGANRVYISKYGKD